MLTEEAGVDGKEAREALLMLVPRAKLKLGDEGCLCFWGASDAIRVVGRDWEMVLEGVQSLLRISPTARAAAGAPDLVVIPTKNPGHEKAEAGEGAHRQTEDEESGAFQLPGHR